VKLPENSLVSKILVDEDNKKKALALALLESEKIQVITARSEERALDLKGIRCYRSAVRKLN